MRSLEEARKSWQTLTACSSLADLKEHVRAPTLESSITSRSIYWKTFLLFDSCDQSEWLRRLADSRSAYVSLRGHFLRAIENPDEVEADLDPLSEDVESPWAALRDDETLRAEILQDVDRCMPENTYFREASTQAMMMDVLFIFCKLNPDIAYRQGMHELLAPILWVVERDSIEQSPSTEDFVLCQVCDSRFVEHDTFTLFGLVMQNAKSFYEQAAHRGPSRLNTLAGNGLENPIITRIQRIYNEYLPHVDPELAAHLKDIDIIPQVFLMKWIRLLFGREFEFDDVLPMWDIIFAEDPSLELVEFVCLTMILRLHWELLEADYNTALTLLLHYPPLEGEHKPLALVLDALYLRDNLSQDGASKLIEKYSGRAPEIATEEAQSKLVVPKGASNEPNARLPTPRQLSSNFESILQDAAKGMYTRGEKWGINKAVRDAVEEVRKGVRDIQASQTQQAARRHSRTQSRSSFDSSIRKGLEGRKRISPLQQRNNMLAKMLKNATDELWDFQKEVADAKTVDEEAVKRLSMAIARVQFVQVYLEDPSIPLAMEEEATVKEEPEAQTESQTTSTADTTAKPSAEPDDSTGSSHGNKNDEKLTAPPPSASSPEQGPPQPQPKPDPTPNPTSNPRPPPAPPAPTNLSAPRPSLAHSSFSWMLGQDHRPVSFVTASPKEPSEKRRSKGFLFGDDDDGSISSNTEGGAGGGASRRGTSSLLNGGPRSSASEGNKGKRKEKGKKTARASVFGDDDEEKGFDLSTLKEGG